MSKAIAVQCGHGVSLDGGWDPGCVYKSFTEAALMLKITKAAVKYLRKSGVTVISDSDHGNNKNMIEDVRWANNVGCKLYVSIHCDYSGAPKGVMPLYVSSSGKKIGKCLEEQADELRHLCILRPSVHRRAAERKIHLAGHKDSRLRQLPHPEKSKDCISPEAMANRKAEEGGHLRFRQ